MRPSYPHAEDHMELISDLMELPVMITEKIFGAPFEVTARWDAENDSATVGFAYEGQQETFYAQRLGYFIGDMLKRGKPEVTEIKLHGLYLEDGNNPYGITRPEIRLFDLEVDGTDIGARQVYGIFHAYAVPTVPVLNMPLSTLSEWLRRRPLLTIVDQSRLGPCPRLGLVIRPIQPQSHPEIGNVILTT